MARTAASRNRASESKSRTQAREKAAGQAAHRKAPKAPPGLGAAGLETWQHVWTTCPHLDDTHRQVVHRLADLADERDELRNELRTSGRVVTGSRGQPVQSPLLAALRAVEVSISRSERQLGISVTAHRAATVADFALLASGDDDVAKILERLNANPTVQ